MMSRHDEPDERREDVEAVGDRVEELAEPALHVELAGDLAVEVVGDAGEQQEQQGEPVLLREDRPEEDGHAEQPQHRQDVGDRQQALRHDVLALPRVLDLHGGKPNRRARSRRARPGIDPDTTARGPHRQPMPRRVRAAALAHSAPCPADTPTRHSPRRPAERTGPVAVSTLARVGLTLLLVARGGGHRLRSRALLAGRRADDRPGGHERLRRPGRDLPRRRGPEGAAGLRGRRRRAPGPSRPRGRAATSSTADATCGAITVQLEQPTATSGDVRPIVSVSVPARDLHVGSAGG